MILKATLDKNLRFQIKKILKAFFPILLFEKQKIILLTFVENSKRKLVFIIIDSISFKI